MGETEPMDFEVIDEYREGEYSPFTTLNDDCLLHIFSFLSLTDRVRVERGKFKDKIRAEYEIICQ